MKIKKIYDFESKFTKEELKEMKKEYGENFDTIFDDKELDDIKEDGEEIVLTKEE